MEMKGLTGGFYRLSEWVMRLSAINLLWIACSLPVIFLLFAQFVFLTQQPETVIHTLYEVIAALMLPLIIAPFTFYPATSAMFSMARKWALGDLDIPLFKSYFRFFKANYKQAMLGGITFNLLLIVLLVNVQFYADQTSTLLSALNWLFLLFLVIVLAAIVNFFCYLAHFEMTFGQLLKNSLLFTIARPMNTIYVLAANGAIIYISFFKFTFLIVFFMGTIAAIVTFWGFLRSMQRIQDKIEKLHEEQEEAVDPK
jgi:uncharacterized membrane protein YesL